MRMKAVVMRSLSAMGSRMAPRSDFMSKRRAMKPSSRSVRAARAKIVKALPWWPYHREMAKKGIARIRARVRRLGRVIGIRSVPAFYLTLGTF